MTWRLAKSLETLREQINRQWPNRSKVSDGTKGDPAHAARKSDHNPNAAGVVCALDITHDPVDGPDARVLAERIRVSRDPRIKYIISARRIASPDRDGGHWRPYDGANAHTQHVHFSVKADVADDDRPWAIGIDNAGRTRDSLAGGDPPPASSPHPVLRFGAEGTHVADMQEALNKLRVTAIRLKVDGKFGVATENGVRLFQTLAGLTADGIAGPKTWAAIDDAVVKSV